MFSDFLKMGLSRPQFSSISFFQKLTVKMLIIKFYPRLDLSCRPLVSEATTLPPEPQPLPHCFSEKMIGASSWSKFDQKFKIKYSDFVLTVVTWIQIANQNASNLLGELWFCSEIFLKSGILSINLMFVGTAERMTNKGFNLGLSPV